MNIVSQSSNRRSLAPYFIGIFMIVIGAIALATPVPTSLALASLLGALFLIGGIGQLLHAFSERHQPGAVGRFLLGALAIVAGALTLVNPVAGTGGITIALSFYLLLGAFTKWSIASAMRPARGAGWLFFSGLISFLLGTALIFTYPNSSLIVPGVFFGVDMIFYGSTLISITRMVRKGLKLVPLTEKQAPEKSRAA